MRVSLIIWSVWWIKKTSQGHEISKSFPHSFKVPIIENQAVGNVPDTPHTLKGEVQPCSYLTVNIWMYYCLPTDRMFFFSLFSFSVACWDLSCCIAESLMRKSPHGTNFLSRLPFKVLITAFLPFLSACSIVAGCQRSLKPSHSHKVMAYCQICWWKYLTLPPSLWVC